MEIIRELPENVTVEELSELIDSNVRTTRIMTSETKKSPSRKDA